MSVAKQCWKIQGEYFESCNCELLCPCLLSGATAPPTEGHCDVVLAFRIDKGNYGATDISGLNAAQALITPGIDVARAAARWRSMSIAAPTRISALHSKRFSAARRADRLRCSDR